MVRLFLASGYAFAIRVRRLVTGEAVASTAFAVLAVLVVLRGVVLGVHALDAASLGLPDRAFTVRLGIATSLFASVIGVAGVLGVRLGLGLPVQRYLQLPFRFEAVYRCHLLWSLVGWWLVLVPLFDWLIEGLPPVPAPAGLGRAVSWLAVLLFVLATNATADALGSLIELRFHRGWRWVLAATAGLTLFGVVARLPAGALRPWPLPPVMRWTPPGTLASVLGAGDWRASIGPLLGLVAYAAFAAWGATWLARRVHLSPVQGAEGVNSIGQGTVFFRTWRWIRALGVPSAFAALAARETLLFVRARRLRFICASAVILTFAYGIRPGGMSPLTLTVLLCFPLALLTAVFNNAFGFDRGGALGYLALPIVRHQIFLAKGVVFGVVTVVLTVAGAVPVVVGLGAGLSTGVVPFSLLFGYLLFGFLAVGNLVSVVFPKVVSPQSLFGWLNPVASLPLALACGAALVAPPALIWFGGSAHELPLLMAVAVTLTLAAWVASLFAAAALLRRRGLLL